MRFFAGAIGKALARAAIIVLIGAAFVVADVLGFLGLALLGVVAAVISLRVEADERNPAVWPRIDFSAAEKGRRPYARDMTSPEKFAADEAEQRALNAPLRFIRWSSLAQATVGAAGFIWQQWL